MSDGRRRTKTLLGLEAVNAEAEPASAVPRSTRLKNTATLPYFVPPVSEGGWRWSNAGVSSLRGIFRTERRGSPLAVERHRPLSGRLDARWFRDKTVRHQPTYRPKIKEEPDLPAIGSVIDKYELEQLLGIGGFAAVYRAKHRLLGISVAVKLLRPSLAARRPELATLLCREAQLVAKVDHPNVVRIFDVTRYEGGAYLVMEYVHGHSLATLLRRGDLSIVELLGIAIDVVRGLEAGLGKGLIHRDIKPANIMVTREGRGRIVDLGLALAQEDAQDGERRPGRRIVGTASYMAPEQRAHPESVDFRADMYALGVTLYEALCGRLPIRMELLDSGNVPPDLASVIRSLIEEEPAKRPSSYRELEDRLTRLQKALSRRDSNV